MANGFSGRTMTLSARSFGATLLALMALMVSAASANADAADALTHRIISNIATIEWDIEGKSHSAQSNRVDITIEARENPLFSITAYRFAAGSASERLDLSATVCRGPLGSAPVALSASWQNQALSAALAAPVENVRAGEPFIFVLDHPAANADPATIDTISAIVVTRSGDREALTVSETASNSGRFAGLIQTGPTPMPPSPGDCRLTVDAGDRIFVESPQSGTLPLLTTAEIDVVSDPSAPPVDMTMSASAADVEAGSAVHYTITVAGSGPIQSGATAGRASVRAIESRLTGALTITDTLPPGMRLLPETLRLDGQKIAAEMDQDGQRFRVRLPALASGASARITFAVEIQPGAKAGDLINRAEAIDDLGNTSSVADAVVRVRRDLLSARMTIVGRLIDGGCRATPAKSTGIGGVRIMLEDGSYAVTDNDGRYHFEGVTPGLHVVQVDTMTLPADRAVAVCEDGTRSAGRAFSRFVEGRGGALVRADFRAVEVAARPVAGAKAAGRATAPSDAAAAGAETDWLHGQQPGTGWIFPAPDHNPRAPVVRVAIKHLPGQMVRLLSDGRPVDPVAFDGAQADATGTVSVSVWRGIPLENRSTTLTAEVRNADGSVAETLRRTVHYAGSPMQAELLRDRSVLVADGVTRPVIALRLTDRDGRPVRSGLVGDYQVPAPYYPAVEADAQQARQLAGLERARPFWRVEGDEGIAYVELEPTTASGTVSLRFGFRDGEAVREQRVELWLDPGQRPWTIVGLAEGTIGFNRLAGGLEALSSDEDKLLTDGRLALYAKGRVRGKWLMTLAYDSNKRSDETRFGGAIDPDAYYTVYADRSERRYDAASVRRLYLKLERPQFYALFGDYETGIDEPELARYVRAFNGVKAEYRSDRVSATAFAADSPNRHRRDDIQGNGLSGPYALGARSILANSERVTIEVRDRLRSDRIVETRLLTRHIDYDIDYRAGTLRFREPILSRSSALDPQFIVAEYEVDGVASRSANAGARASWRSADGKLQLAATAIRDASEQGSTLLAGTDLRYRPSPSTEIRAEAAVTGNSSRDPARGGRAAAWLIEAEHHGPRYDVLAYARQQDGGFGVGQLSRAEDGTRKIGFDARASFGETWSLTGSAWHEDYLASDARRTAARGLVEYRRRDVSARAGITIADDRLADGRAARSTIAQFGASKRMFDNKLELDAQTELPLGGDDQSVDFPARHRLSARYSLNTDVHLVGSYEIADGEHIDARMARIGFDLRPWAGARIALTGNVQNVAEYGPRTFAAYGLSQSFLLGKHWSVDFSLDGNETVGGIDPARVLNPLHPVASGGYVGSGGTLTEDFTAVTAGATYRARLWSITGRAEYRAGSEGDRYGFTAAALRQIGEGSALGGAINWFTAEGAGGAATRTASAQLSWAHRPSAGSWSWLEKLELREDQVVGGIAGQPGPVGTPPTVTGNARSRRMVNALSINFSPDGGSIGPASGTQISLFWGSRYVADSYGEDDFEGWSNLVGADLRFDLSSKLDLGVGATLRHGMGARSVGYSIGPSIGATPFENGWMSIGWNLVGFHDRDFAEARYTRAGPYVTMRLKFDQMSLQGLGLGRK